MTALPEFVGVVGGGRMGAGIAHVFLDAGCAVVVIETGDREALAARERVESSIRRGAEKHTLRESAATTLDRLRVGSDLSALASAGLVVEAVPETPALKAQVYQLIEGVIGHDVPLASNTSSLSIGNLAGGLRHPGRFVGMHFFNPVPTSDLVEIVVGANTAATLVVRIRSWVDALGKTAITVRDAPGFASSRLGLAIALEAMRMFEDGVASAEDIDTAMTLGYRHAMGPLRTTDLVGLDVRLAIAEHLERELGPRFAPPQVLRDKVAAGHLGRKSGQGFYSW